MKSNTEQNLIQVESTVAEYATLTLNRLYREVIIPTLSSKSTVKLDSPTPTYKIDPSQLVIPRALIDVSSDPAVSWVWSVFEYLSWSPLQNDDFCRMPITNLGCMIENILAIRRLLLVDSESNPRYVYDKFDHHTLDFYTPSSQAFKSLTFDRQIHEASNLLYTILAFIIVQNIPQKREAQLQCISAHEMSLIIWGAYKKKKKNKRKS